MFDLCVFIFYIQTEDWSSPTKKKRVSHTLWGRRGRTVSPRDRKIKEDIYVVLWWLSTSWGPCLWKWIPPQTNRPASSWNISGPRKFPSRRCSTVCCEQKQCLRRQYTTNKESWMLYKERQEVATHGKYFSRTVLKILTMLEKWNGFVFSKSVTFHKSLT